VIQGLSAHTESRMRRARGGMVFVRVFCFCLWPSRQRPGLTHNKKTSTSPASAKRGMVVVGDGRPRPAAMTPDWARCDGR